MKEQETQNTTTQKRVYRYFSEDFKRKKVQEIDNNLTSISQSGSSVFAWTIYIFGYLCMLVQARTLAPSRAHESTSL